MIQIKKVFQDKKFQIGLVISFFIIYFILGILFVNDYGVSTDEPQERKTMYVNLNYILTELGRESMDVPELETYKDKYYGMALQMPMCIFELLGEENLPLIYLCRHFYTFSLCFVGYIFFFLIVKKLFQSNYLGILGSLMLMIYPRFLAEQFYNLKDMVFMSAFIISMYATIQLIESDFSNRWIVLFSIIVAITTNVRIVGAIFIILLIGYIWGTTILQSVYKKKLHENMTLKQAIKVTVSIGLIFTIVFAVSIPGVWENPIKGIFDVFLRFSDYPGGGNVVFMGQVMENTEIPWYYIPIWLLVSIPLWYILLFIISGAMCGKNIITDIVKGDIVGLIRERKYELWSMMLFMLPWLGMVLKESNLYNGWRHCYFMIPPMILIAIFGIKQLIQIARIKYCTVIIILIGIIIQISWIAKNHPYEMVYFNNVGQEYAENFDRDYWHLSETQAWKYISEIDDSDLITVNTSGYQFFTHMLPQNEKRRVEIAENPMYYVETYRGIVGNNVEKEGYEEIYSIIVDDFKIASILKRVE